MNFTSLQDFFKRSPFILVLLLSISLSSCSQTSTSDLDLNLPELIPYRKGDLWGYSDEDRSIKIPCTYDYAELFDSLGFAKVYNIEPNSYRDIQTTGLIDKEGTVVVPLKDRDRDFNYAVIPDEGYLGNKFGIYDCLRYKDKLIVLDTNTENPTYKNIFIKSEYVGSYKDYCYNRQGELILSDSFYYASHYETPNYEVIYIIGEHKRTRKQYFFSKDGKQIFDFEFDRIGIIDSSLFIGTDYKNPSTNKQRFIGIYNVNGETVLENAYELRRLVNDFCPADNRYFNFRRGQFLGKGYKNSHLDYSFSNGLVVVPDIVANQKVYSIVRDDLTPFVPGSYSFIKIDSEFKKVYLSQKDSTKCYDLSGKFIFSHSNNDTFSAIDSLRYVVKTSSGSGVWSSVEMKFIIKPYFKQIESIPNSQYILTDISNKKILTDSQGDYSISNYYERMFQGRDFILAFNGDSLFRLDYTGQKELVAADVRGSFLLIGDILYYEGYNKEYEFSLLDDHKIGYNFKTKEIILDSLRVDHKDAFKFHKYQYLKVREFKSWDQKSGYLKYKTGVVDSKGEFILPSIYDFVEVTKSYILGVTSGNIDVYSSHSTKGIQLTSSISISGSVIAEGDPDIGLIMLAPADLKKDKYLGYISLNGVKYYE